MKKIFKAFLNSCAGLRVAFLGGRAFRQELYLAIIIIPAVLFIGVTSLKFVLLLLSLLFVMAMELVNTAIEALSDRITQEVDPAIKIAKDVGSAAVLLALINLCAVLVFIIFF